MASFDMRRCVLGGVILQDILIPCISTMQQEKPLLRILALVSCSKWEGFPPWRAVLEAVNMRNFEGLGYLPTSR